MHWPDPQRLVVGWDVGGAHVKACVLGVAEAGEAPVVLDIAQWACPLWQGLIHLDAVLLQARARWPQAWADGARHAATMTGEMVDLFANREDGVRRLAAHLAEALGPTLALYADADIDASAGRWVAPPAAGAHWRAIASANWHATAEVVAARLADAVLVDTGSTTTDLIVLRHGRVASAGESDAQRLVSGALVYQGVVRTPLCALAQRVPFGGAQVNVMNEFFATTADVYRLTGELDPAHDQQAAADNAAKDAPGTRQRLARMIGRDADEASPGEWLGLAAFWRGAQLAEVAGQLGRVLAASELPDDAPIVGAGCGDFLAAALADRMGRPYRRFAGDVIALPAGDTARWTQVCAPAVAVAWLLAADRG
jgi:probable H4MPT-linked C1 transfer pathway protein